MNCWQKLSKRFVIRIALPHLLLSVIAAAFSLSAQGSLPANPSQPANIITIAAVMVNLHEHKCDQQIQSISIFNDRQLFVDVSPFPIQYSGFIPAVRLTPHNGIRAGPSLV